MKILQQPDKNKTKKLKANNKKPGRIETSQPDIKLFLSKKKLESGKKLAAFEANNVQTYTTLPDLVHVSGSNTQPRIDVLSASLTNKPDTGGNM